MPYLTPRIREHIDAGARPAQPGELNYKLSMVCLDYLKLGGECYNTYNDIIGALEAAKLEFYRRLVGPYENTKRDMNGDVF